MNTRLTRVAVQHYKSLGDVTVDLHPQVTVLVGPNATGKSNWVDALRFLRDACRDNLDHAIVSRGGIARIRQSTAARSSPIRWEIKGEKTFDKTFDEPEGIKGFQYLLELTALSGGNYRVEREDGLDWDGMPDYKGKRDLVHDQNFTRSKDGIVTLGHEKLMNYPLEKDQLWLGTNGREFNFYPYAEETIIFSHIRDWTFSTLYPNVLRQLMPLDTRKELREDASNWASVVRAATRTAKGKRMLERVVEMMKVVLPDFQGVRVTTAGSYLVPYFQFAEEGQNIRQFDPVQLSDGTLRIFGLLLSLYQSPPPSLMVIEEPEQTVHPGVLGMLADAFKEVSEVTQVVVTTHSPHLVEHFAPEHIRVVSMDNGLTHIAPIKHSQQMAVQRGLMSLGEFMAAEGLQPEGS